MASFCKILLVVLVQMLCWIPATRSECLNNYKLISSNGPWNHGAIHYGGHIVPNYAGEGPIRDWTLTINFTAPLAEDLETWNVLGFRNSVGKSSVVLTAEYESNERINKLNYHFNYIAAFKDYQWNGHLECVQFCGILDSGENTCDLGPPQPVITTTSPPPVTTAVQTGPTIPTTPYVPSTECGEDVLHIDGSQESMNGRPGFINAHWLITAPKWIKFWKLTFKTDRPFKKVRPFESKLIRWVGPNTYRFKNSRNQRVIRKGETLRVGWEAKWRGPRPKILSAVVTSWSLPEDLVLCQAPMTTKQPATTAAPDATTASPEATTAAPEATTAAPDTTTASPKATTAAPELTTAEPESTTAAPEATTAAPGATTASPEATTAAPELTTAEPESTTAAPEATTAAPDATTASPEATTAAPELTTAEPEATTAAPKATTAEPEATTVAPELTTAEPEATTAEPEATTAEPEATTAAPEATTAEPEVTTATPEVTTSAPEASTAAPEATTAALEVTTTAPEVTTSAPEGTTAAPEATTTAPEVTTVEPEAETTEVPLSTTVEPAKCIPKYNYSEVLEKSLLFYEAQRSGRLPANNRVSWRGDSATNDGSDHGNDLSGGYYDAGDFVKFGFPMAASITNLAWGMIEFKQGYVLSDQYQYGLDALKWGTDYFIKCHTQTEEFWGQVGDGNADHSSWGRPEEMTMARPSYSVDGSRPGSELAGETAAALAATSMVFKDAGEDAYAEELLQHARELFEFANSKRKQYHESLSAAAGFYRSYSGFDDELAWACLWLYKATNEDEYRTKFTGLYSKATTYEEFSWDNKWAGVQVLASTMGVAQTNSLDTLRSFLQNRQKTPKGLIWIQKWGANRHAANLAFLSLVASKVKDSEFFTDFTRQQIHYMLGDTGRSYVVGFGTNPPQRPHHRSSSCPIPPATCDWGSYNSPDPNPHVLYGALVGGPDANDNYEDRRNDFVKNEVAMDYNAGFQSAIAGLVELAGQGKCGDHQAAQEGFVYGDPDRYEEKLKDLDRDMKILLDIIKSLN